MNQHPGRFITLEGIDGAGKSTHVSSLVRWLEQKGKPVQVTREPGGTPLGEQLRGILLQHEMEPITECLLMFAARHEHLNQVIAPSIASGVWVVSDRFTDASFAYQGGARGLSLESLELLESWAVSDLQPDLTFLFDLPPQIARARRGANSSRPDRFEQEPESFFALVRTAYLERARKFPERFIILDARATVTELFGQIQREVESRWL